MNQPEIKIVAIIVENLNSELLFMKRDDKPNLSYPGCWALIGGHVELGEDAESALRREIKEELNFAIDEFKFLGSIEQPRKKIFIYHTKGNYCLKDFRLGEGQDLKFCKLSKLENVNIIPYQKDFILKRFINT